ncbi:MAG TPA: FAD:protein FMN transferase [Flavobacteriales bacterium]|nr:FAD:protein FMN transferase [Flavobacteriales bacterium]HIL66987.1 FAD:protein FMN transferase [Flavobacteriales bacterium]
MKNILYLFLLILCACSSSDNRILVKNSGEAQGTYYHIQYMSNGGKDFHFQIDSIFKEIDSSLSIYKDYSLISKLNKGEDVKTDTLFNTVFKGAQKVFLESEGNFDCSVSPLVNAWGFYKYKLGDSLVIDSAKFRKILPYVGFDKISLIADSLVLPKGMRLDFNAIAQGYTVDVIAQFLQAKGYSNYLIEVGGELLAKGKNADGNTWRVGVDKPSENIDENERFQFILNLENKALATSGNYRKFYEKDGVKYAHTINPFTGFPTQNRLLSVTVIHDNCMLADAYATAFMVMGVRRSKQFVKSHPEIEIYLVYTNKNGKWNTFISADLQKRIIN